MKVSFSPGHGIMCSLLCLLLAYLFTLCRPTINYKSILLYNGHLNDLDTCPYTYTHTTAHFL